MAEYRIVQDRNGPYAGRWLLESSDGRVEAGPFDSEADARYEMDMRARHENAREVY